MSARSLWLAMALVAITVTAGHAVQGGPQPGPKLPFEDKGACPFECCTYREWWPIEPVEIRTARQEQAPVAFTLKKDEHVRAVTGVVVTTKPGTVKFSEPVNLDTKSGVIQITPEDSFYLLTYLGEGYTKAWFKGRLYTEVDASTVFNGLCERDPSLCKGKVIEPPVRVWWVQVRNARGQTGWTSEPDKFDNKDACGIPAATRLTPFAAR